MFGSPETTTGGKALKFYASVRIDVRKGDVLKDATGQIGNRTKAKIVKNKLAPPFKVAEFDIIYGKGISREGCIIDMGIEKGVLEKSGAWISYNGEKLANGRDKTKEYLMANPEIATEIEQKIASVIEESKKTV